MLVKEFRITLPLSVPEYHLAQLYSVVEAMKTQEDLEGAEVLKNEPFTNVPLFNGKYSEGQFTYKIYHAGSKLPAILRLFFNKNSLDLHEESWNAYPYIRTIITCPSRGKDNCYITIHSIHLPDRGERENAHGLPPEMLTIREVIPIDITDERSEPIPRNVKDPKTYVSLKTGRGPLTGEWMNTADPVMTCYKLVTANLKIWAMQSKLENFAMRYQKKLFTNFHRDLYCSMDNWIGLSLEDIRTIEDKMRAELLEKQGITASQSQKLNKVKKRRNE